MMSKRVLHILGSTDYGGIPSVVYNYMSHIDRERYHFDLAINSYSPGNLGEEMIKMGASVYWLPLRTQGLKKYVETLTDLLQREHYDAIHVHSSSTSYVDLRVAKKMGIKCRIAHAHTIPICSSLISHLRKYSGWIFNRIYATTMMACSKQARDAVFGPWERKTLVLPNAIETDRFRYDQSVRDSIRKSLNIEGNYVIGMVASFSPLKNHRFALEIAEELCKEDHDTVFVLVGDGQEYQSSIRFCQARGLQNKVIFLGKRQDPERLYQAFDICILPSFTEGFAIAGLEAITSGLPLLLSNNVPADLSFGDRVSYLPLVKSLWVEKLRSKPSNPNRAEAYKSVKAKGYDITDSVHLLEAVYEG